MDNNKETLTLSNESADKLEAAKTDFNETMAQIEPFIKKSSIFVISTEGKWRDTSSISDTKMIQRVRCFK